MSKRKDLTGQKFGKLTVLRYSHTNHNGVVYYECKCECGNTKVIGGNNLKNNTTKSCGCLRKERMKKKAKTNKGGIYPFQTPDLKYTYNPNKVKEYKLSPKELERYLKELNTKEVKYRGEEED